MVSEWNPPLKPRFSRSHPICLVPPCDQGCDGDGGHEGLDVSVEASCDAAPVLEAADHSLDDVALAIDGAVVFDLDFAVGLGRDDRRGAALSQPEPQSIAVVDVLGTVAPTATALQRMNNARQHAAVICPRHPARVAGRQWLDPRPLLIRKSEEIPHTPHLLEGDR